MEPITNLDMIGLALIGFLTVFAGLFLITGYIIYLPKFVDWRTQSQKKRKAHKEALLATQAFDSSLSGMDPDLLAAITFVIQSEMERTRALETQRITIQRDESQRIWAVAGKMRTLSTRL